MRGPYLGRPLPRGAVGCLPRPRGAVGTVPQAQVAHSTLPASRDDKTPCLDATLPRPAILGFFLPAQPPSESSSPPATLMIYGDETTAALLTAVYIFVLLPLIYLCLWETLRPLPLAPEKEE